MQQFEIYISDKTHKFNKSKLNKKDKKLYQIRKSLPKFLLSRSIKSRIKKRGKFCISHKKFGTDLQKHVAAVGVSNKKFGLDLEILQKRDYKSVIEFWHLEMLGFSLSS